MKPFITSMINYFDDHPASGNIQNKLESIVSSIGYEIFVIPNVKYVMGYPEVEKERDILFDSDIDYLGEYECSRCSHMNYHMISEGTAGECVHCEEVDYWDLNLVQIDEQWYSLDAAYKLLKKRNEQPL